MYQIISGEASYYVDGITYIRVNEDSGCYVICDKSLAEGICVKIPVEVINENESFTTCEDKVFALVSGGLNGVEDVCDIKDVKIALDYYNAKKSEELLTMLEEVL